MKIEETLVKHFFESQGIKFKEAENNNEEEETTEENNVEQSTEPENPVAVDVDPGVDSAEQVAENVQANQDRISSEPKLVNNRSSNSTPTQQSSTLQLADGTDSGISVDATTQVNELDPTGTATIQFSTGNFNQLSQIPNKINEKISTINQTILPLINVALIELLGNNSAYKPESFQSAFKMDNNIPVFTVETIFKASGWIGNDVAQSSIAKDAEYILNRINVVEGVNYTKCEINCGDGSLTVNFTY